MPAARTAKMIPAIRASPSVAGRPRTFAGVAGATGLVAVTVISAVAPTDTPFKVAFIHSVPVTALDPAVKLTADPELELTLPREPEIAQA
jgi:hypothetical protein